MDHSYADQLIDSWDDLLTCRYNIVVSCPNDIYIK